MADAGMLRGQLRLKIVEVTVLSGPGDVGQQRAINIGVWIDNPGLKPFSIPSEQQSGSVGLYYVGILVHGRLEMQGT